MNENVLNKLDPLTFPLFGERLIEASAGTGKTFTISTLYLRLLLGLGKESAFFRPLTVKEILVVTFTEVATEELRKRIRYNIHELRLACIRSKSEKSLFSELLSEIDDLSDAIEKLILAEQQIDEAAIYTIHGFCQRMVTQYAFESSMLFKNKLIKDTTVLSQQACADFWRRYCYPLPLNIAYLVNQEWSGPEELLNDLSNYLDGELPIFQQPPKEEETLIMRHERIISRIDTIKAYWQKEVSKLEKLIYQSDVDKHSYSTKHLLHWLSTVSEWAMQETLNYQLPKELNNFRQSVLLKKTKQGKAPYHAIFTDIDELFLNPLTLRDLIIARALSEIYRLIQYEKQQRAELGFNDLLNKMDAALQSVNGQQLAKLIRQRYPVAIIDEFQDTDPQQYRIFKTLYIGHPNCGLLLIGDPKQAIYAFRGADIFTYMRAHSEVKAHYTLEVNWRSSPTMVASINKLFCQLKNPFLFSQIPFIKVGAAEKNHSLVFQLRDKLQPAIQFWLQHGENINIIKYQKVMAQLCAAIICDWLTAGQKGQAWLYNGISRKPVQASNITVLVRNRNEATQIQAELSALSIPSIYLSNRDSVFDTPEAKDLLWLLQAVLVPEEAYKLRTAISTSLIGLNAANIADLISDEVAWDALVDEFNQYRIIWRNRGILPMLSEMMKFRNLAENLLATPFGERRLTNVLHLSELLQENTVHCESEYALIRWLSQKIAQPNPLSDEEQLRVENDCNVVQVITIHKSKGLEFDLVLLPFIGNFRKQKEIYHDRYNFNVVLKPNYNTNSLALAEEERLAEDLRLLYVALTRSVYHCSIGIAPIIHGVKKKKVTQMCIVAH